ncbi:MAG: serine hydrolase [Planctomycetes bacterium]|nr:serine hydrolase [Planctomycetota bacterium]
MPASRLLPIIAVAATLVACRAMAQTTAPAREPGDLQQRLDRLAAELDAQRERLHVPGLSVAIVRDDTVVMARGFGERDLQRDLPATADTIYAVGSTTKAFTAALVAMLVDDGTMTWDDPVRTHLPTLAFKDPATTEHATLRDLLAHRTGLMGMDLLWLSGEATWEDMLAAVARAEPTAPLRERFQNNNVMYVAAGRAAAAAAGTTWEQLIEERLFRPLGMSHTTTSIDEVRDEVHLARGYAFSDEDATWKVQPLHSIANAAPAAAINSNVLDMAKWIRLLLREGRQGDDVLISTERLKEMWTSQIEVTGDVGAGMGWMLSTINGRRLVSHHGGFGGYSACVALLPEEGLGCVLLANARATTLPALATSIVFDHLLDAEPAETADAGASLDRYLGVYRFDRLGVDVTVLQRDGRLALDVPGQRIYDLEAPDADGRRGLRGFEPIAVAFEESADGPVPALSLFQRGEEYRLPRRGQSTAAPGPDETQQADFPGAYRLEETGDEYDVRIADGALVVDVPGQIPYTLSAPDDDGWWAFREVPSIAVRFDRDAAGVVSALTVRQQGRETSLPRLGIGAADELPSALDVMEMVHLARGSYAYEQLSNMRLTGTVRFVNQGVEGTMTVLVAGYDRYVMLMEFPPFGWVEQSWVAWIGARDSAFGPMQELDGPLLEQLKHAHPAVLLSHWRHWFEDVRVLRVDVVDDEDVYVLRATPRGFPVQTLHVRAKDGRLLRAEGRLVTTGGSRLPVRTTYEDYRSVEGAWFPFRVITADDANGRVVVQFDEVQVNRELTEEPWFMVDGQGLRNDRGEAPE